MSDFASKSVIVTGGAKGIGAGIVRAFAASGARVACTDVDATAGAAAAGSCECGFRRFAGDRLLKSLPEVWRVHDAECVSGLLSGQ